MDGAFTRYALVTIFAAVAEITAIIQEVAICHIF